VSTHLAIRSFNKKGNNISYYWHKTIVKVEVYLTKMSRRGFRHIFIHIDCFENLMLQGSKKDKKNVASLDEI